MSSSTVGWQRSLFGAILFVALTGILFWSAAPADGQVVPAVPSNDTAKEKKEKTTAVNVMTFPQDRDAKQMLEAVQQYLTEYKSKEDKAPWDKICFAAQQVLDAKSDSFFEQTRKGDTSGKFLGVSAKSEANRLIGLFPPTGKQFYQLNYGPPAESYLKEAIQNNYDKTQLSRVSQQYFHTKAGA
ncbi:MAG: hypothetical protein ACRCZF_08700, partial [Gemmataceae bacterium]